MKTSGLRRSMVWTLACVLALGAIAFWPRTPWTVPHRPPLKAPIVFDQLENLPPPAAPGTTQAR